MSTIFNAPSLIVNSLVTMLCGVIILYFVSKGKIEKHLFYYGWSTGFILYGVQIFLRALFPSNPLASIPMLFAFLLFPISTWTLSRRKDIILSLLPVIFLYISLPTLVFLGILNNIFTWPNDFTWIFGSIFFLLPVAFTVVIHRKLFGNCVDKLDRKSVV